MSSAVAMTIERLQKLERPVSGQASRITRTSEGTSFSGMSVPFHDTIDTRAPVGLSPTGCAFLHTVNPQQVRRVVVFGRAEAWVGGALPQYRRRRVPCAGFDPRRQARPFAAG